MSYNKAKRESERERAKLRAGNIADTAIVLAVIFVAVVVLALAGYSPPVRGLPWM